MSNQFVLDPPWANPGNRGDYGPDATEEDLEKAKAEQEEIDNQDDDLPDRVKIVPMVNINFFPEGEATKNFVTIVGDPAIIEQAKAAAQAAEDAPDDDKPEVDEMGNPIISEGEGTPNEEQVDDNPTETEEQPKSTTTDNYL